MLINLPYTFSAGQTIIASQHNSNNQVIFNAINGGLDNTNLTGSAGITYANLTLTNGIVNADINSSAAIAGTKIASIGVSQLTGQLTPQQLANGTATSGFGIISNGTNSTPSWASVSSPSFQVFTSSGTWTKPSSISSVFVKMIGPGGNGGNGGASYSGAGGGGGGYAEGIVAVSGDISVVVAGTTSFSGTTVMTVTAGGNGPSGSGSGITGGAGGSGNLGGGPGFVLSGGTGGSTGSEGGDGAGSYYGTGGVHAHGANGGNGNPYGGGGAGGYKGGSYVGGTGGSGAVIVIY